MNIQREADTIKRNLEYLGYDVCSHTAGTGSVYISVFDGEGDEFLFDVRVSNHDYSPNNGETEYMIGLGMEAGFDSGSEFIIWFARKNNLPLPPAMKGVITRRENREAKRQEEREEEQAKMKAAQAKWIEKYRRLVPEELRRRYDESENLHGKERKRTRYLLRREIKKYLGEEPTNSR